MTRLTDSVVAPWPDAETILAVSSEWSSQNPLSGRGGFGSVFSNFEKDTVESDLQWSSQISRSQNSMIEEIIEGDLWTARGHTSWSWRGQWQVDAMGDPSQWFVANELLQVEREALE